jgi:predicted metal-dependent peptidase
MVVPSSSTEALTQARVFMIRRSPFLGYLAMSSTVIFMNDLPMPAGTNGASIFFREPDFSSSSIIARAGLLAHEVIHLALGHCTRRGWREKYLWNLAADLVDNEIIEQIDKGLIVPGMVSRASFAEFADLIPPIDDLTPEVAYAILDTQLPKDRELPNLLPDILPSERQEEGAIGETVKWRSILFKAAQFNQDKAGRCPGWLQRDLGLSVPTLDWKGMLSYFVGTIKQPERSFQRLSRRHLWRGSFLPGQEKTGLDLAVVIDESGSISQEELSEFMGEVAGIINSGVAHITLVFHDAEIQSIQEYKESKPLLPFKGGGGTLFAPVCEWANNIQPDGIVWLTDGMCADNPFPPQPPLPVIWVLTNNHFIPPWGWHCILRTKSLRDD